MANGRGARMEALIFIGIQGSGKTTFYQRRFFETHVRVNLDMLHTRARERALIAACLASQKRFVIDNTNPRAADRAGYIAAAKAAGFRIIGYFFQPDLRGSLRRNASRAGRAVIPVPGVIGTLKRLEAPTWAEGFDELYSVSIDENGQFVETPVERAAGE